MKGILVAVLAFLAASIVGVVVALSWAVSTNNNMVAMDESVKAKWSQVENVYQRRSDLIPNLVNTVKGYAKHEASVLEEVAKARASAGQVKVNASSAQDLAKFDQAQSGLSQALSRLMVISERYPELKANQQFQELQSQLEGTENRISVERRNFNESAQVYNTYIKTFPAALVANFRGFHERAYFQAQEAAKTAPKVEF